MNEENRNEKMGLWRRYRTWLAGLTKMEKIRFRIVEVVVILALMVGTGAAALNSWIRMPDLELPDPAPSEDSSSEVDNGDLPDVIQSGRKDGIYTFLVAGKDVASGGTDTMLLISYDTNAKKINGVSLPRDTMINTTATSKRLNAVYARNRGSRDLPEAERDKNGMQALQKEVAKITGIMPDFYVLVEWEAIGELVEAIGGVYFEVPFDMVYNDPYQNLHINQKAGYRLLSGTDAMQVIRFRKNDDRTISLGDVGRMTIQQNFLKAVATKCLQPATFLKLPELAKIFSENVSTNLTVGNILALARQAMGMDPETDVTFQTLPLAASFLYRSAALVTLDGPGILKIVNDGMNPYQRDIAATDLQLMYRNSNGSFTVTNGKVEDTQTTKPSNSGTTTTKPDNQKPVDTEEPETPIQPETPTKPSTGDNTGGNTGGSTTPQPEPKPDPQPEPKPDPQPDPQPDPKPDPKPDPEPEPEPKPPKPSNPTPDAPVIDEAPPWDNGAE